MQCVRVLCSELHESHVGRLGQLRYASYVWEKPVFENKPKVMTLNQ